MRAHQNYTILKLYYDGGLATAACGAAVVCKARAAAARAPSCAVAAVAAVYC